jgi:hypothetical protein
MLTTAEIVAARFARSSSISAARPGDRQGRPPAYSPGGLGAILIFQDRRARVDSAVASLPLALAGLFDTEIIELLRFAGLTP